MTTAAADRWPSVQVVVVNWNGRDDLERCLASLAAQDYPAQQLKILVVDNASTDDSREVCQALCPLATWVGNPTNVGYTRAVNQGIAQGLEHRARYLWVLNNDVVLPPDTLRRLVDVGQAQADVGVICPVVYQLDDPGRIVNVGYDVDLWTGRLRKRRMERDIFTDSRHEHADVDSVLGCSNLIKTEVVEWIGRFREIYGLYFEDTDFNVRARAGGYRVVVVRQARVLHRGSSTMNRFILLRAWLLLRNLLLFEWYNAGPVRLAVFLPYFALVHLPWFLLRGCIYAAQVKVKSLRPCPTERGLA